MDIIIETLQDEIASQLSKRGGITEKSWIRWSDKNKLSRSIKSLYLSERGIAIDKLAKQIVSEPQFENYEEKEVIEQIVEFTIEHPNRKSLNAYIAKRAKAQRTPKQKIKIDAPFEKKDNECFVNSLKKELTTKEIIEEMKDLKSDPKNYFGKLLITTTCKKDFLSQPFDEQKKIAESVLKDLQPRKKRRAVVKPSLQSGLKKIALWGLGFLAFRKIL